MRIFSVPDGDIVAEIDAHAGWITGMDLASQTGRLVTTAEDGIVRVRKVSSVVFSYIYAGKFKTSNDTFAYFVRPHFTIFVSISQLVCSVVYRCGNFPRKVT